MVRTLFVSGLPYDIKRRELHLLFHTFKPRSYLGLRALHLGSSAHTRTPQVRLWAELRDHCQVPHHGASLSPKLRFQKNCDLSSLLPWLPKSFAIHLGLFSLSVCLSVWRRLVSSTV